MEKLQTKVFIELLRWITKEWAIQTRNLHRIVFYYYYFQTIHRKIYENDHLC